MTIGVDYSLTHRALLNTAARHGLAPTDVRVALVIDEWDGEVTADDIIHACRIESAAVRRAVKNLRNAALVTGGDKTRVAVPLVLTKQGHAIAEQARQTRQKLTIN